MSTVTKPFTTISVVLSYFQIIDTDGDWGRMLERIQINNESNHTLFYEIFIPWKGEWREKGRVSKVGVAAYIKKIYDNNHALFYEIFIPSKGEWR